MSISVIIPAYNEELSIDKVLKNIETLVSGNGWEVIVVDDGSTDKTADIIKKHKYVRLIKHPYNKGYGAAIKTGINNSHSDLILTIDADNQHSPQDIKSLIAGLEEYDLVIGARGKDTKSNFFRNCGNFILRRLASFLVNVNIPDLTSGFRAFRRKKILNFMHLYPNGFSISATSTLAFISAGYNVKFIPVRMNSRTRGSKSQIKLFSDGCKFFLLIFRIVTLFNPLKIFFPASLIIFLVGLIYAVVNIFAISHIPSGALLAILSALIIFFFGLIADQLSVIGRFRK